MVQKPDEEHLTTAVKR